MPPTCSPPWPRSGLCAAARSRSHGLQPGPQGGHPSLYGRGTTLLLKDRPRTELPRELLPCFKYSIIDLADERRSDATPPAGVACQISHVQAGVRSVAELDASFKRGAVAVLGWPIDNVVKPDAGRAQPDLATLVELMHRIDNEESIDRLEDTLKLDPRLAFKLLRYINWSWPAPVAAPITKRCATRPSSAACFRCSTAC